MAVEAIRYLLNIWWSQEESLRWEPAKSRAEQQERKAQEVAGESSGQHPVKHEHAQVKPLFPEMLHLRARGQVAKILSFLNIMQSFK